MSNVEFLRQLVIPTKDLTFGRSKYYTDEYQEALKDLQQLLYQRVNLEFEYRLPFGEKYFRGLPFFLPEEQVQRYDYLGLIKHTKPRYSGVDNVESLLTIIFDNFIELTVICSTFSNDTTLYYLLHKLVCGDIESWVGNKNSFLYEAQLQDCQVDLHSPAGIRTAIERVKVWEAIDYK